MLRADDLTKRYEDGLLALSSGPAVAVQDLPLRVRPASLQAGHPETADDDLDLVRNVRRTQTAVEERLIRESLRRAAGNRSQAARLLGISRRTLFSKMKDLAIAPGDAD